MIHLFKYLLVIFLFVLISCTQTHTEYWDNGHKKLEYNLKNGKKHGYEDRWFQNGRHQSRFEYRQGLLNGKAQNWYYTGNIEREDYYEDGKLNGITSLWTESGQLSVQKEYRDDVLHGIFREWFDNGQLKIEGRHFEGFFDGIWVYYDTRGIKVGEGNFEKGRGVLKAFYINGSLQREVTYKDNLKNGEEIWYFDDGSVERIVIYIDDRIVLN